MPIASTLSAGSLSKKQRALRQALRGIFKDRFFLLLLLLLLGSLANLIALRMTGDSLAWIGFHAYAIPFLCLAAPLVLRAIVSAARRMRSTEVNCFLPVANRLARIIGGNFVIPLYSSHSEKKSPMKTLLNAFLIACALVAPAVNAADAPAAKVDAVSPHGGAMGMKPDLTPVNVAKATGPNARTVAEVVSGARALKDKAVEVHGKVVKFNPEIMGKNWMHLRDGSGKADDGTNDILVTTMASAKVGDVVTVTGTVRTDKDFGSGYAYKVLIEEASLK